MFHSYIFDFSDFVDIIENFHFITSYSELVIKIVSQMIIPNNFSSQLFDFDFFESPWKYLNSSIYPIFIESFDILEEKYSKLYKKSCQFENISQIYTELNEPFAIIELTLFSLVNTYLFLVKQILRNLKRYLNEFDIVRSIFLS